jgi:hypothetical protein
VISKTAFICLSVIFPVDHDTLGVISESDASNPISSTLDDVPVFAIPLMVDSILSIHLPVKRN